MAKIHGVMDIRAKFEAIPSRRSWDTTFTRMGGVEGQTEGWDRWPVPAWRCKNVYKKFYVGLRTGLISHETVESIFSNRSHRLKRSRSACFAKCQTIPFFGTTSWWLKCTNTCTNWQTRTCTHTHTLTNCTIMQWKPRLHFYTNTICFDRCLALTWAVTKRCLSWQWFLNTNMPCELSFLRSD